MYIKLSIMCGLILNKIYTDFRRQRCKLYKLSIISCSVVDKLLRLHCWTPWAYVRGALAALVGCSAMG